MYWLLCSCKKVEGWDGNVLWLKVTENEVKENYERDTIPDPNNYYIKEYQYYAGYYYPLPMISRRYSEPHQDITTRSSPEKNVPRLYKYVLCNQIFDSQDELDKHIDIAVH